MAKYLKIYNQYDIPTNPVPFTSNIFINNTEFEIKHNVACQTCFENPAIYREDYAHNDSELGLYPERFDPCKACQKKGWVVLKLPFIIRFILKLFWN